MFSFFLIFFIQNNNAMLAESERDDGKCGCIKMQTVYLAGKTAIIVFSAQATHGAARRDKREKYTIWYDNVIFRDNDFIFFLFFHSPIRFGRPSSAPTSPCGLCELYECRGGARTYFTIADIFISMCFFVSCISKACSCSWRNECL